TRQMPLRDPPTRHGLIACTEMVKWLSPGLSTTSLDRGSNASRWAGPPRGECCRWPTRELLHSPEAFTNLIQVCSWNSANRSLRPTRAAQRPEKFREADVRGSPS